jgi:uncharacterized membrane protein required for colicin V production
MFMNFINSFNWVDLLIAVILLRVVFIGIQTGIVVELFKLLGVLLTAFVCLHYYSYVGIFLQRITKAPAGLMTPIAFVLLWAVMFLVCWLIREGLLIVFTIEAQSLVDKWGGAFLGLGRFFVVASMVIFLFLSTGDKYFEKMVVRSFSQKYVLPVAPGFYSGVCDGFLIKVFPGEKMNVAVGEELKKVSKR